MKRPILIALIGYIIGILWGLYLKTSIVLFFIPILICYIIKKYKIEIKIRLKIQNKLNKFRYIKYVVNYIKVVLNGKIILIMLIFATISNTITIYKDFKYDNLYKSVKEVKGIGVIISQAIEKDYKYEYKLKISELNGSKDYKNTILILNIKKQKGTNKVLEYGDRISFLGEYIEPDIQRNYGGFNYKEYLKTINAYGNIQVPNAKISVISKENGSIIQSLANKFKTMLINNLSKILSSNTKDLAIGVLTGETLNIDSKIKEDFRNSNLAHMLAVSGTHVAYVILGLNLILKKLNKRKAQIIVILCIAFFMFITGFTPSVTRAGVSVIIIILGKFLYRESDIINAISLSLLLILISNPFVILNIGLILSYGGTIRYNSF